MSKAATPQPEPQEGRESVVDAVLADIEARRQMGREKYGMELKTFNNRDALWDAYQEQIDLLVYMRQFLMEGHREVVFAIQDFLKTQRSFPSLGNEHYWIQWLPQRQLWFVFAYNRPILETEHFEEAVWQLIELVREAKS